MMKSIYILLFLMIFSCSSYAKEIECKTSINAEFKTLYYYSDDDIVSENYSYRERVFHGWGDISCPAHVTLRYFTPEINDLERSVFCLKFDNKLKTYTGFVNGDRDAYLTCKVPKKSFCQRLYETKNTAVAFAGLATGVAVGGANTVAGAAGVTAVAHSSGALILTGSGGYIAGTLGTVGATSLAVLTAPATIAVSTVSVVAVGGALYFCSDKVSDDTTE